MQGGIRSYPLDARCHVCVTVTRRVHIIEPFQRSPPVSTLQLIPPRSQQLWYRSPKCISKHSRFKGSNPVSNMHGHLQLGSTKFTDRDQTQIEPFSARHNVVVGRNGSGKSNFFAGAYRFGRCMCRIDRPQRFDLCCRTHIRRCQGKRGKRYSMRGFL